MRLHGFFRSSAAWRVRIALAIKSADYESVARNFRMGEQRAPEYVLLNPQGLVPALETDVGVLTQSLAIIEYLDEMTPEPAVLPSAPRDRAVVRAMAQIIACDIHPINNLRVLDYLRTELGADAGATNRWYRHWVETGFDALETIASREGDGRHCFGNSVSLADICLVPQIYNAWRFDVDLGAFPTLAAIDTHLRGLDIFHKTAPELQPDVV